MLILDLKNGAPPSEPCRKAYNHLQVGAGYSQLCRENESLITENHGLIPGLEFFPDEHIYTFASKEVPSVTQLLKPLLIGTDWVCSEEDMNRGQYVHRACEMYTRNLQGSDTVLDVEGMEKDYLESSNQLRAFVRYILDHRLILAMHDSERCLIEIPLYSQEHGFAGTPDYIFPKMYPGKFECMNVFLQRDGKYKPLEYPEKKFTRDFRIFKSFLAVDSVRRNGME